jgi:hypothetical protein
MKTLVGHRITGIDCHFCSVKFTSIVVATSTGSPFK